MAFSQKLMYLAIVALSVLSFGLLATAPAMAGSVRGNERACMMVARAAQEAAEVAISGVPWGEYEKVLQETLTTAMGKPGSIITDEEDATYVYQSFKRVYAAPSPDAVMSLYMDCMSKPKSSKSNYRLV